MSFYYDIFAINLKILKAISGTIIMQNTLQSTKNKITKINYVSKYKKYLLTPKNTDKQLIVTKNAFNDI